MYSMAFDDINRRHFIHGFQIETFALELPESRPESSSVDDGDGDGCEVDGWDVDPVNFVAQLSQ